MSKILLAAITASIVAAAVPAKANTFTYSGAAVPLGQNITLSGIVSETVDAGQIVLTGSGANAGSSFDAWCVDVFHLLQNAGTYNIAQLTTAGAGSPNPALTNAQINQMGSLMIAGNADILDDKFGVDTSPAFQLAIWAVEYGGTLLDNADGTLANLVATLVDESKSGGALNDPNAVVDLLDAPASNQVLAFGVDTTPIPASVWSMLAGLGLLGFMLRRSKPSISPSLA